jgi:hypothetical protein
MSGGGYYESVGFIPSCAHAMLLSLPPDVLRLICSPRYCTNVDRSILSMCCKRLCDIIMIREPLNRLLLYEMIRHGRLGLVRWWLDEALYRDESMDFLVRKGRELLNLATSAEQPEIVEWILSWWHREIIETHIDLQVFTNSICRQASGAILEKFVQAGWQDLINWEMLVSRGWHGFTISLLEWIYTRNKTALTEWHCEFEREFEPPWRLSRDERKSQAWFRSKGLVAAESEPCKRQRKM